MNKTLYHSVFAIASSYVIIYTTLHHEALWLALLILSFLFHWWIGTLIYLHLPARKHISTHFEKFMSFLIFLSLVTGIIFFYLPVALLALFGIAFVWVIPIYHTLLQLDDDKNGHKEFIRKKYYLEYFGGAGFFAGIIAIHFNLMPVDVVINSTTIGHLVILYYLFKTKTYHDIITNLNLKFFK